MDELLLVLNLFPFACACGVDAFLGLDDPNPTGVCLSDETLPPPDLMLDDLLTLLPPSLSSEFRETWEPDLDGGREPPFLGGGMPLWRRP